jgi:TonB family protein
MKTTLHFLITLILISSIFISCQHEPFENNVVNQDDCKFVEILPTFPNGEKALLKHIISTLVYPEYERINRIEGRVIVSLLITKLGKLENVSIARSLTKDCDAEAIRIVKNMPDWIPGRCKDNAVDVSYTLGITFKL